MVVHIKRHKVKQRKLRQPRRPKVASKARRQTKPHPAAVEVARSPSEEEAPKPEELAKEEEAVKVEEVEEIGRAHV